MECALFSDTLEAVRFPYSCLCSSSPHLKVADCSFHSAVPEDVLRAAAAVQPGASEDEEQAQCEFLVESTAVGESRSGEARPRDGSRSAAVSTAAESQEDEPAVPAWSAEFLLDAYSPDAHWDSRVAVPEPVPAG